MASDKQVIVEIVYDKEQAQKDMQDFTTDANKRVGQLNDEIFDLTESNKRLAKEIKNVKGESEEDLKIKKQLNSELQTNKDRIKAANRERTQTIKTITGEKSAFDKLTEAVENSNKKTRVNVNILEEMPGAFGGVVGGIKAMIKSSLAFIATPLGAILAAIVGAVTLLTKAFKRSEGNMNKIREVTSKVSGVFNGLLKALEPVANFIADKLLKVFDLLGKGIDKATGLVAKGLAKLGFKKAAERVEEFTQKLKEASAASAELARMEAELVKQQRLAQKVQLDYQKLAEKQRQIRDDEARSIEERIKANEELGRILDEQLKKELATANLALRIANQRIKLEGETTELLDARAEALTNIADIQERITGQESEQLVNVNSLLKEKTDLENAEIERKKKLAEEEQKRQDKELEAFQKKLEEEEAAELEKAIREQEAEDIRRAEEIVKFQEQKELEYQIQAENEERLKELREQGFNDAYNSMQEIIAATSSFANQRVNILQDAFSKIATINLKEVKSSKDAFLAIGSAARKLTDLIVSGNQAQLDDLQAKKDAELVLAGDNTLQKEAIERKYNKKLVAAKKAQAKEEKTKATIDAVIATALGVTKALGAPFPLNLALPIIIGTAGGVQIATIRRQQQPEFSSDKVFSRGGGIVDGASHSKGGVNVFGDNGQFFGNVEGGEAMFVMKKDATAEIAAMSKINESYGGRSFSSAPVKHAADGGQLEGSNVAKTVQEEIQRTPIFVRVGDIETGITESSNVKNAGVI